MHLTTRVCKDLGTKSRQLTILKSTIIFKLIGRDTGVGFIRSSSGIPGCSTVARFLLSLLTQIIGRHTDRHNEYVFHPTSQVSPPFLIAQTSTP